jgi:hypothetical protein
MGQRIIVLAATAKGLFCFESDVADRRQWRVRGPLLAGWELYSVLGDSRGGRGPRIFAGTHHKSGGPTIQVSENLGQSWAPVEHGPRFAPAGNYDWDKRRWIAADPDARRVWSLDRIWQIVPGAPSEPDTFYAGTEEAALFVSRDGGNVWEEVTGLTSHPTRPYWGPGAGGMGLHTILIDPGDPKRVWVGISCVGVLRTDDGGVNWKVCNRGLCRQPNANLDPQKDVGYCAHKVCLDPDDPSILYMQDHGGVFKGTGYGEQWTKIEQGLSPTDERFGFPIGVSRSGDLFLVPLDSSEQRQMRGGRLRVFRSTDRGASWHCPGDVTPESQWVTVLRDGLCVDELDPYGVYMGTGGGELFYSLDRGTSWSRMPAQLPRITAVKTWVVSA